MIPAILGAVAGGVLGGLGSSRARRDANSAYQQMVGDINQGETRAVGDGSVDGSGAAQQWHRRGINAFVQPGIDDSSWASPVVRTALGHGAAGWDGANNYWNGFLQHGPLRAAQDQALGQVAAQQAGQGLSNSGAASLAAQTVAARMGYQATRDHMGDLTGQQGRGDKYRELGANATFNTGNQVVGTITDAAGARSNAANWRGNAMIQNNPFNAILQGATRGGTAATNMFGGGGGGGGSGGSGSANMFASLFRGN